MEFIISIAHGALTYRFHVERIATDRKVAKDFERFKLTAGERVVVLQSNRPMLKAKGLKKKPIFWKVLDGGVKDEKALRKVCLAIEKYITDMEKPKPAKPIAKPIPIQSSKLIQATIQDNPKEIQADIL